MTSTAGPPDRRRDNVSDPLPDLGSIPGTRMATILTTGPSPGHAPASERITVVMLLVLGLAGVLAVAGTLAGIGTDGRTGPTLLAVLSAATAVVLQRLARRRASSRGTWHFFSVGCGLLAVGQLLSAVRGVGVNTAAAGVQDLPLLLALPCALVACACMVGGGSARTAGSRVWLDAAVVGIAVAVLGEIVVHDALTAGRRTVDPLILLGYPAVGALLCAVGIITVAVTPAQRRAAAGWLMAAWLALAVVAVSGAIAVGLVSRTLDLVTVLAWLAMLAAGVLGADADAAPASGPTGGATVPLAGVVVSYCAAIGVGVLLLAGVAVGRPASVGEGVAVAVLLALTFVRSLLWAAHGERLSGRLSRAEAWLRALVLDTGDLTVVLGPDTRVAWVCETARERLGSSATGPPRELAGRRLSDLVHPEDLAELRDALEGRPGTHVLRLRGLSGDWREVEIFGAGPGGPVTATPGAGQVLRLRDITSRRHAERELERMAFTDYLTNLPNRARLTAALTAALARARDGEPASLLLLDLDGFKAVNDIAGHEAGDRLLGEVAQRLTELVREPDLVARLGGDEFAVLVRSGLDDAAALARRVVTGLAREHGSWSADGTAEGPVFAVAGSIGVTELGPHDDVATALRKADLALRAAKAAGKGRVRSHGDAADAATTRRTRLAHDLPDALARDQLRVVYQPVVGVAQRRVLGVEALLRWAHPELGEIGPDEFVPLAEDDGLIIPLQRWVLGLACAELAALVHGGRDLRLGVNISVRHLQAGCLVPDVAAALAASGLAADRLMLEVTESVLMSAQDRLGSDLQTLHDLGCIISLDDFGRGYSSFAYLARLPVDVLKMDREFLAGIEHDERGAAVVQSVIELGTRLGIDVVAEGVETPAELAALHQLGCRYLQGFLLALPTEAGELADVIDGFDPALFDRPMMCAASSHSVGNDG